MRSIRVVLAVLACCTVCAANGYAELQSKSPHEHSPEPAEKTHAKEVFKPAEFFDEVWEIINNEFWDPNLNGVDWQDARRRYRPRALAARNHESFAVIVNQMLAELKTSHTRYFAKWDQGYYGLQAVFKSAVLADVAAGQTSVLEQYLLDLRSSKSEPHRNGIGMVTKKIEDRHYVTAVLDSSPAEKAGIVLGDWIVEADGKPFHPIRSFEGKAGKQVRLTVQNNPSETSRHLIKVIPVDNNERELFENASRDSVTIIEHKGHRFAYARLWWLSGLAMRYAFDSALNMAEQSEGIIVDIRDGFGGGPPIEYVHSFLKGGLETITVETTERDLEFKSTAGFNKPVVILINSGSRSGKELLAYYFKKIKTGILVGERTAGYVVGGRQRPISENSFLYYAACMIVINGKSIEGVGIEPDIEVRFDIRFAAGRDIQLERAKDEMVRLIKKMPNPTPIQ